MSHQYQPTAYYDWVNRTHGVHLVTGNYQLVPYDYYAGDELHIQNVVFRNSEYVTYDNTHVRFLNKSDIHVYDTSSLVIHDSGTLTMHTSSAPGARTFIVDEIGRVGIGMNHLGVHSNHPESPSFDLDVRGQVGIEDYIYHNDDTDTYMLFGTDTKSHHVNADGSITPPITPPNQDYDEVNFRVGGVDMLQMKEDDTQDELVVNKNQADVDTIIRTSTNTQAVVVSGDGSEVVINGDGNSDTDFRVEGNATPHMLYVDTSEDHITINGAANDDTDLFTVTGNDNASLSGASLLSVSPTAVVINEDSNLIDTRIESNTNTTSILVKGDGTEVVVNDDGVDTSFRVESDTNTTSILVKGDGSEVVVNDDGNGDTDFRIESDKSEKMLFVDTSTDMITLSGPGGGDDTAILDIQGNDDDDLTGASLLYVDPTETVLNKDANDHNFRVVAQNLDPQQNTTDTGTDGNVQNHTAALASHALFVDATNGRVGIGHNNPATTLHVAGSAHIEGDLWVKGVTNQIDTLIHATSAMDITNIGTGPALTVTQSGAQPVAVFWDRDNNDTLQASLYLDDMTRMGVGTSSPEHAVHISDTVESQAGSDLVTLMIDHNYNHGGIGINSTNKDHQNHVRFLSGGDETWQMRQPLHYTNDPDSLRFTHSSRSFDVITMIPTGDVGIGVNRSSGNYDSAPQYRLQIAGDTNGSQDIVQITTNDTSLTTGQEQGLTFGQVDMSFSKVAGFYQGSGVYGLKLYSCLEISREPETRGNFRYNDLAGITLLGDNKTGINLEAPTAQLHVYRGDQHETQSGLTVNRGDTSFEVRATAPILNLFNGSSGSTEVFRVQGDGKTGIGTDNPDTALHVQRKFNTGTGSGRTALQPMLTLAATRGTGSAPYAGFGPSIDFKSVNYDANSELPGPYPIARIAASITNASSTHTGGSLRFFTTPLDTATSNDDLVQNMVIMPSGNVGVGLNAPACSLDVTSTIRAISGDQVAPTSGSGLELFATATKGYVFNFNRDTSEYYDLQIGTCLFLPEQNTPTKAGNVGIGSSTPHTKLYVESTDGLRIPVGTTAQRPTNAAFDITATEPTNAQYVPKLGTIRYNTTQSTFEGFGPGNQWGSLGGVIDPDRDTYWTAINDLDNLHDLGGTKYGNDEFDPNTAYPGDVDYLRAFTQGVKRFAIASNGDSRWYFKSGGTGATTSPYTYQTMLQISTATGGSTIFNPSQQKDITIKTENMASTAAGTTHLQAGDINIISGLANDRTTNGNGNHGGHITIRTGDGGNALAAGHTGGDGGDVYIQAGTKGTGTQNGIDGAVIITAPGKVAFKKGTDLDVYNDTNDAVTFSVNGGTGATFASSLTLTTDLAVAHGGTGVSTLADKSVMITQDSGTDQVHTKAMTTSGVLLIGGNGGPETSTLTAGTDITITNATNAITIAHTGKFDSNDNPSVTVSARTFVNKLTVDDRGHVTAIGTATEESLPTRASLGLATSDNVQFAGLGIGMAPTTTAGEINASADIIAFSSSDERLKDNVTPISDPIEKLSKIGGYEFDWKDNDECSHTGHDVGVIAQEIEQVLPDIVTTRDSGYKAVKYEKLTALLIEVTKSQQTQIDELKHQVEQLSKQL